MKILILGSGVQGVTTAYFLSKRGYEVTVVDREPESARECSFANGGQLSYCHAEPWANPASLKKALKWLGRRDAPLYFRLRADWRMFLWAAQFLRNCTEGRALEHTRHMLRLGLYSREVMHELQCELALEFNYCQRGILHVFTNKKDYDATVRQSEFQASLGAPYETLTGPQCAEREPALKHRAKDLVGGVYYPLDESADIFAFTKALAERDKTTGPGVKFLYGTNIVRLHAEGARIVSVQTDKGMLEADLYVMALGAYSPVYLRQIGIRAPIYPMKGYSISIAVTRPEAAPQISITDQAEKLVYSRLGDILRVAGTAEFAGYDHSVNAYRVRLLKESAKRMFPGCGDIDSAADWACLRPSTPDGPPILGRCRYDNLILNTGHGTLGWTQAAGSAKIAADIIDGKQPGIDLDGLTMERYRVF